MAFDDVLVINRFLSGHRDYGGNVALARTKLALG